VKRTFFVFFVFFVTIKVFAIEPYPNYLDRARSFIKNSQFTKCIEFINNKSKSNKINSEGILLLSEAYLKNYEFKKADSLLSNWIKRNKSDLRLFYAYQLFLETKLASSQYDSVRYYLKLINNQFDLKKQDQQTLASFYLTSGIISSNNSEKSFSLLKKSFSLADKSSSLLMDIHRTLGVKLVVDGKYDSGLYHFNRGLSLQNKYHENDTVSFVKLSLQKAYTLFRMRKIKHSISIYEDTLRPVIFKKRNENQQIFNFLKVEFYRLSIITYSFIKDYKKTIEYGNLFLKQSRLFYHENHLRYGEVYRDIANAYLSVKKIEKYFEYTSKSLKILKNIESYNYDVVLKKMERSWIMRDFDSTVYWSSKFLENSPNKASRNYFEAKELRILSLMNLEKYEDCSQEISELLNDSNTKLSSTRQATYYSLYLENLTRSKVGPNEIRKELNFLEEIDSLISSSIANNKKDRFYPQFVRMYNAMNFYKLDFGNIDGLKESIRYSIDLNCLDCTYEEERLVKINKSRHLNEMIISNYLMAKYYLKLDSINNQGNYLEFALQYFENCHSLEKYIFADDVVNKSINDKIILTGFKSVMIDEILEVLLKKSRLGQGGTQRIFEILESKKETILTDNIKNKVIKQDLQLPDSLSLKIRSIEEQIKYLKRKINSYPEYKRSRLIDSWKYSLQLANQDLEILSFNSTIKSIRSESLAHKSLISTDLESTKNRLNTKALLVHYYNSKNNTYALAISPTQTEFLKLDPLPDSLVQQFRNSLDPLTANTKAEENYRNYVASAYAIYQSQLKPVLDKFPEAKKIYVIPDGQLHHIPFDALISELPTSKIVNYDKLHYLIKDYTFSYANSATTLFKTKSLLRRFDTPENKVLAFAPSYETENTNTDLLANRSKSKQPLSTIRGQLSNLKWNGQEVASISQFFEGESFISENAHEKDFKEKANDYGILHLSMHAVVDQEDPMYSYLAFAPDPQDTSTGDGFLHAFEIYDMDLNAEMAVLSACNTGYGKLYKGEGPMSLAKAFTYAGCPSVVMSYWPADDQSSSDIMTLFYSFLAAGMNKDEALRKAKLTYFETASAFKKSPAYWNNFVVMGDVSPIVKDHTMTYLMVMGTVLLFFVLIWLLLRVIFKKRKVIALTESVR